MKSESIAYLNGQFLPASQAYLSLDDAGFVWGATITDRLRTFRQRLFRLDDHFRRFRQSCDLAFIPQARSDQELAAIANELVAANAKRLKPEAELSLVMFATPGTGPDRPTFGMQATPLLFSRYERLFREGAALVPVSYATPSGLLDPRIKHRSRLAWWIAKERIDSRSEPLFTDGGMRQQVRETASANVLFSIDGELVSPPRSTILNGISLAVVEELCAMIGIPFSEREIPLDEAILRADESFLSNSSFCLAPVSQILEHRKPLDGLMFRQLLDAWSDLVGVNIRGQFSAQR